MPETRIRWEDVPAHGETLGWVGDFGRPVFSIWPPDAEGERVLLAYLAGEAQHMYHDGTADALKALKVKAERLLAEFVASLGAVFPEPGFEFDDDDGEPLEVKYAAGKRVRYVHPDYGYPGEQEPAAAILVLGAAYIIAQHSIGQSRTGLILEGIPGEWFNSVLFEPADDETPAPVAGEE